MMNAEESRLICQVSYVLNIHGTEDFFGLRYLLSISTTCAGWLVFDERRTLSPIEHTRDLMRELERKLAHADLAPVSFSAEFHQEPDRNIIVSYPCDNKITYVSKSGQVGQ